MLKRENYTSEHIDALRKQTGADPSILERTVFAFWFAGSAVPCQDAFHLQRRNFASDPAG